MEERRNFYLIFKEAINNLVKYSGATYVVIELKEEDKLIKLIIRDNGTGFNIEKVEKGNGLNNMKRRAKEIEAELLIDSSVDNGTTIWLTLKA